MTLGGITPFKGFKEEYVLFYGRLATQKDSKDPIDVAILSKAEENSIEIRGFEISQFKPFDPVSKRTEASIESSDGKKLKVSKGATQVILSLVGEDEKLADNTEKLADKMNEYVDTLLKKDIVLWVLQKLMNLGNGSMWGF